MMNRQFIVVTALISAMAATSCVDDAETQQTTDARNATADLVAAKVELQTASTAALKIESEADVALTNAKADVAQAQANLVAAEAASQLKANEVAQLKAQLAATELEADKMALKVELENNTALKQIGDKMIKEAEIELEASQYALMKAKHDAETAYANADKELMQARRTQEIALMNENNAWLHEVSSDYFKAIEKVNDKAAALSTAKKDLADAELKLKEVDATQKLELSVMKIQLSAIESAEDIYKNFASYLDEGRMAEIQIESKAAQDKIDKLTSEWLTLCVQRNQAAEDAMDKVGYYKEKYLPLIEESEFGIWSIEYKMIYDETHEIDYNDTYYSFYDFYGSASKRTESVSFEYEDAEKGVFVAETYGDTTWYDVYLYSEYGDALADPRAAQVAADNKIAVFNASIATNNTTISNYRNDLQTLQSTTRAKKQEYDNAYRIDPNNCAVEKAAYTTALQNEIAKQKQIDLLLEANEELKIDIYYEQKNKELFSETAMKNFKKNVAERNRLIKEEYKKVFDFEIRIALCLKEKSDVQAEKGALDALLEAGVGGEEGANDIMSEIEYLKDRGVQLKKQIELIENTLIVDDPYDPDPYIDTVVKYNMLIEKLKEKVAKAEADLLAAEMELEARKKAFDKAMGE